MLKKSLTSLALVSIASIAPINAEEKGPLVSPVVLYSSGQNLWKSEGPINSVFNSGILKKKKLRFIKSI